MEQRHGLDHRGVHAIARVLRRQDPLHAGLGRGGDELGLLAHGHEAEGEDGGVDVAESGLQEIGVRVGAFLDVEGGVAREGGGGVGAGDDGDVVEVVGGEEGFEDFAADCAACLSFFFS